MTRKKTITVVSIAIVIIAVIVSIAILSKRSNIPMPTKAKSASEFDLRKEFWRKLQDMNSSAKQMADAQSRWQSKSTSHQKGRDGVAYDQNLRELMRQYSIKGEWLRQDHNGYTVIKSGFLN